MKRILISSLLAALVVGARAQCGRTHPRGVNSPAGGTMGCNEVDGTSTLTWFTMPAPPSAGGGPLNFRFVDPPSAGSRPPFAYGYIVVSLSYATPGILVPGTSSPTCRLQVAQDLAFPLALPLLPGCHDVNVGTLPPNVWMAGRQLWAQTWAIDLTNNGVLVTNTIAIVVQA